MQVFTAWPQASEILQTASQMKKHINFRLICTDMVLCPSVADRCHICPEACSLKRQHTRVMLYAVCTVFSHQDASVPFENAVVNNTDSIWPVRTAPLLLS